ncbi:hypothetical protein OSTOST_07842 [Ostertagia ostertagi]
MLFTWTTLLLALAVLANAVPLGLVQIACARNPKPAFCDSHILGLPNGGLPSTTSTTTSKPIELPEYSGNDEDFVRWLNDQNDELEVTVDERESNQAKHADKKEYCAKYKANFGNYCKNGIEGKLEGVLPQFCALYVQQCGESTSEFPRPGPLLKAKKGTAEAPVKAADPPTQVVGPLPTHAASEAAKSAETAGFKGGVLMYCEKFADQFKHFCEGAQRSEFGKANEFCASYRDSCKMSEPSPTSKIPADLGKPESSAAGGATESTEETEETNPKPLRGPPAAPVPESTPVPKVPESPKTSSGKPGSTEDSEELPDSAEIGAGSQSSAEQEKQDKEHEKDPKVQKYCEDFSENYNFYCAGDQSTGHEKFCRSFRTNCPHKLSS